MKFPPRRYPRENRVHLILAKCFAVRHLSSVPLTLIPVASPVAIPVAITVAIPVAIPVAITVAIPVTIPAAFPIAFPVVPPHFLCIP
ncbi:hypothetical protein Landi51_08034 [Colletotrichum acutatum]